MSAWYEMILKGREDDVRDLLPGVATDGERPLWGTEVDLHAGSFPEHLLGLLGARTHQLLFVPGTQVGPLVRAIQGKDEFELERVREITGGRFTFRAEAFSAEPAGKIKRALHAPLPEGVVLEGLEESEDFDPAAQGVELYSPAHAYTYRAQGTFLGAPPGIFEIHHTLSALDFVHQEKLELDGRLVEGEGLG
ncbi:MAG TPA: hypothetical protein DD490_31030 [Acidobacteria bacterium]|nr:hypothetical protein [Acidobacteriota bacterium]